LQLKTGSRSHRQSHAILNGKRWTFVLKVHAFVNTSRCITARVGCFRHYFKRIAKKNLNNPWLANPYLNTKAILKNEAFIEAYRKHEQNGSKLK